jgi:indole-3-glycerol phosphate synthase
MAEMPDILRKACEAKEPEIAALKRAGRAKLVRAAGAQSAPRGFKAALTAARGVALIAEVKKASPSAGVIREDFDPVEISRAYERGGAACISVLTDRQFFQGDPSLLSAIREGVALPLLRKDFMLDELQVLEARALGADACLLIVTALEPRQLERLLAMCRNLGMDALVEVHTESELKTALLAGADLVGINNRDLRTFKVSLDITEKLAPLAPPNVVLVSESGIKTPEDVKRLKALGVKAALVGEALMRAADIEAAARAFANV